jgi:hypothetical protein
MKNMLVVILLATCLLGFAFWNLLKSSDDYSAAERRRLAQFPTLTVQTVLSGDFMEGFEGYAADQFPLRDKFRALKAYMAYSVLGQADNNGIYVYNGYIVSMDYPLNERSIDNAAQHFRNLYEKYMQNTNVHVYGAVVPDKNYFAAAASGHLALDYEALYDVLSRQTDFVEYIDLRDLLSLDNYYRTDLHWRQEVLTDVAARILDSMGVERKPDYDDYDIVVLNEPFYGAYYGQAALPLPADSLAYLTNDVLPSCSVHNFESGQDSAIYDMEKASGRDPYESFLSGSVSLLTIENPKSATDRELVIFRDSFGSSLAPLLVESYAKVTLVDIRYLQSERLGQFLQFDDQDVLFLYSTLVLNNSETLK